MLAPLKDLCFIHEIAARYMPFKFKYVNCVVCVCFEMPVLLNNVFFDQLSAGISVVLSNMFCDVRRCVMLVVLVFIPLSYM